MAERTCSIDACTFPVKARGWCQHHYNNWYRRGDPLLPPPKRVRKPPRWKPREPVTRRFWSKVDLSDPDGCWPWAGSYRHSYGEFWVHGKKDYAHRVAASLVFGELEDGETVLHICDNPACVRPDHLRVGTQTDNMRDCGDKGRWKNQHAIGPGHPDLARES